MKSGIDSMTEKRFKLFVGKNYGVQKVDGEVIFDSIISMAEADVLVDLLNDLTEDNEQLKSDLKDCKKLKNKRLNKIRNHRAVIEDLGGSIRAYKRKIEQTAKAILDARKLYPDSSLADLYDELTMPPKLRKAHQENDKAVMEAYGFSTKMTESECVAKLMEMYQELVA